MKPLVQAVVSGFHEIWAEMYVKCVWKMQI